MLFGSPTNAASCPDICFAIFVFGWRASTFRYGPVGRTRAVIRLGHCLKRTDDLILPSWEPSCWS